MIINHTSGNKIPLERDLRELCKQGGIDCHVFAVFDMCKSLPEQYPGLTYTAIEEGDRGEDIERATMMVQDIGFPFHAISAAELQSTTKANSELCTRMINHIEERSK